MSNCTNLWVNYSVDTGLRRKLVYWHAGTHQQKSSSFAGAMLRIIHNLETISIFEGAMPQIIHNRVLWHIDQHQQTPFPFAGAMLFTTYSKSFQTSHFETEGK